MDQPLWIDALADLLTNSLDHADTEVSTSELTGAFSESFRELPPELPTHVLDAYCRLPIEVRMNPFFRIEEFILKTVKETGFTTLT
jgi:hypothetical protein